MMHFAVQDINVMGVALAQLFANVRLRATKPTCGEPRTPCPQDLPLYPELNNYDSGSGSASMGQKLAASSLPTFSPWLHASQLLEESLDTDDESPEPANQPFVEFAPQVSSAVARASKPAVDFNSDVVRCHSSPECAALVFATIQDYQRHLVSHATATYSAPSSPQSQARRESKCSRSPRQRLQQRSMLANAARRRASLPAKEWISGQRRQSLVSGMAALSLQDLERASASPHCLAY